MRSQPRFCLDQQPIKVFRDPVPHVVIDELFGEQGAAELLAELVALETYFVPAGIGEEAQAASFRQHRVFGADAFAHEEDVPEDFSEVLRRRAERLTLLGAMDSLLVDPLLREVMDAAPYPLCKLRAVNRWETQVSRYGNGDHYGWHHDRIDSDNRIVSLVYYLSQSPAPFQGGLLQLSGGLARDGKLIAKGVGQGSDPIAIEPKSDRLVIFSSRAVHRVTATQVPASFSQGRFSVNVFGGIEGSSANGQLY